MDRYTAFTPTLIRHVTRTGVFIAVVLAVIFVVWRKLPAGFLPEEDQGYVMVMVSTPEASARSRHAGRHGGGRRRDPHPARSGPRPRLPQVST